MIRGDGQMKVNSLLERLKSDKRLKAALIKYARGNTWRHLGYIAFRWILFSGLIYVLIYPLLYIMATSVKTYDDLVDPTTVWITKHFTLQNIINAYNYLGYAESFKNSLIIAITTSSVQIIMCSVVGYGFARFKFREKGFLFGMILFTMIIPPQTMIIPQYIFYRDFDIFGLISLIFGKGINMHDTYAPFILPTFFGMGLKSGLFIYIFRQFFRGMPKELEDAAYIDGCGPRMTYWRVMLPNAAPAILTVFLFSFVWHWNDVFEPTMFLQSQSKYTLSLKLIGINGYITKGFQVKDLLYIVPIKYGGIFIVILPMILLYLLGQKYFVRSVERSGIIG
jgi:multiple sugar transport system permease protein